MSTLVDSNVLIDVLSEDARWFEWSAPALARAAEQGTLGVNPIIYAEVAMGYASPAQIDAVLPADRFARLALPFAAGFVAGRAFLTYRRRGGARQSPLP